RMFKRFATCSNSFIVPSGSIVTERQLRKHLRVRCVTRRDGLVPRDGLLVTPTIVQRDRFRDNVSGFDQRNLLAMRANNANQANERNAAPKSNHDNRLKATIYIIVKTVWP